MKMNHQYFLVKFSCRTVDGLEFCRKTAGYLWVPVKLPPMSAIRLDWPLFGPSLCWIHPPKRPLIGFPAWQSALIQAIPDQIKQVFINLLNNAADALPDGGEITIRTWQQDRTVAIAIEDTGIGIEPYKIGRIFEPFYTTKAGVKGTGLGLSVSHGIVQSHRGEIRVWSRRQGGTAFTVILPIDTEEPAEE